MTLQDDDLVEMLANDLDQAFKHLERAYAVPLYRYILRQLGNEQDAEDVTQQVLMQVYFALKSYPQVRIRSLYLRVWLYKIASNCCSVYRRQKHLQMISLDLLEYASHFDLEDDERYQPERKVEEWERISEVKYLANQLPEQYREVINLHYFSDLSYQEIVDVLRLPMGTVKSHIHRGTRLLRHILTPWSRK